MKRAHEIDAEAADWLAERDGDNWSAERQRELDAWLALSTLNRVAFLRLENAWHRADRLMALRQPERLKMRLSPANARVSGVSWVTRVAASLAVAASVFALIGDGPRRPAALAVATLVGAQEIYPLADGSHIHLNTATRLRVLVAGNQRSVWLDQGEALFDVAHDPARPFVVYAGKTRISVLGTKFSLRREGERIQLVVLEGQVRVQPVDAPSAVLAPTEAALVDGGRIELTTRTPMQMASDFSWLQGRLVFHNTRLADAAEQFNRYNAKQIFIDDEQAARLQIGGAFEANNVEAFARLLQSGFKLQVQMTDDAIRVTSPNH